MKPSIKIEDIGEFLGIDPKTIKDVRISGDTAMVEVDVFVYEEQEGGTTTYNKKQLNHRHEPVINTLRAGVV